MAFSTVRVLHGAVFSSVPSGIPQGKRTMQSSLVTLSFGIQEGVCGVCTDTDPSGLNWEICAPLACELRIPVWFEQEMHSPPHRMCWTDHPQSLGAVLEGWGTFLQWNSTGNWVTRVGLKVLESCSTSYSFSEGYRSKVTNCSRLQPSDFPGHDGSVSPPCPQIVSPNEVFLL